MTRLLEAPGNVQPVVFTCEGEPLAGVLHRPVGPARRGVLIVVGGPQYRVGSHRQFLLLARQMASAGLAVLRFDHRGIGDSGGALRGFEHLDADIKAAIAEFRRLCPEMEQVFLWGLCDAASAALFYAGRQPSQVAGLMLLNPWARTEQGAAQAYIQHYYGRRFLQWDFWRRLLGGKVGIWRSFSGFLGDWRRSRTHQESQPAGPAPLPERLHAALRDYQGSILLVLSGRDLTAREFVAHLDSAAWQPVVRGLALQRVEFPDADHTFSSRQHRDALAAACLSWLETLPA